MKTSLLLASSLAITISLLVSPSIQAESEAVRPSISGVVWLTYWHATTGGPNNSTDGTANSFDLKRLYLTINGDLGKDWSYKAIGEMGGTPGGSGLQAIAKAAFLKWTSGDGIKQSVTFGLQPTLTWLLSENYWGYRSVMNTSREYIGMTAYGGFYGLSNGSAADFGVTWSLSPHKLIGASLQASNGPGHKTGEANMQKRLSLSVALYPVRNGIVEFYFENEGGFVFLDNQGNMIRESREGLGFMAGYKVEKFGFGIDYFQKSFPDKSIYFPNNTTLDMEATVLSLFGNYLLQPGLRALGRIDRHIPVADPEDLRRSSELREETLVILGIDCSWGPPNTNFILTYQQRSFESKPNNGSIWVDRDPFGLVALDVTISY